MAEAAAEVVRQVGRLFAEGTVAGLTDRQLLDRFRRRGDEAAFEALVVRHGPMVLGVCRDVLGNAADAEDAFQAAFLVLLRRAGTIRGRDGVGGWMYRVAYRVALRARVAAGRRRGEAVGGEPVASDDPPAEAVRGELRALVRREVDRLPEKYRGPVVLCDLEGLTHDEAAQRLRWPVGTVKGRLSRARDRLRGRLERLGVGAPAAVLAATFGAKAAVPEGLVWATVRAGAAALAGTAGLIPAAVGVLVTGVLRMMFWNRVGWVGGGLLAGGLLAGLTAVLADGHESDSGGTRAQVPEHADNIPPSAPKEAARPLQGTWRLVWTQRRDQRVEELPFPAYAPAKGMIIGTNVMQPVLIDFDGSPSQTVRGQDAMRYRVDTTRTPAAIDIQPFDQEFLPTAERPDDRMRRGIFRLEGDRLTLVIAEPGSPRPSGFEVEDRRRVARQLWERVSTKFPERVIAFLPPPPTLGRRRAEDRKPKPAEPPGPGASAGSDAEIEVAEMEVAAERKALQELIDLLKRQESLYLETVSRPSGSAASAEQLRKENEANLDLTRDAVQRKKRGYFEATARLAERKRQQRGEAERQPQLRDGEEGAGKLAEPYRLKPGDRLLVEVLEALPGRPVTGERIVRPDGTISLGFYGELPVAGLTTREVKERVVGHMQKFLTDEVLGLVDMNEKGEKVAVPPAESDRVAVDDSPTHMRSADGGRMDASIAERLEAVERKLDRIGNSLEQRLPPSSRGGVPRGR